MSKPSSEIVDASPNAAPPNEASGGQDLINIALIDDNRLTRDGITSLLSVVTDFKVIAGTTGDYATLLEQVNPEVVLLDLAAHSRLGLRLAKKINREFPVPRLVAMNASPAHENLVEMIDAGVYGFTLKDASVEDLAKTVRLVASGVHVLPRQMTGALFSQVASRTGAPGGLEQVRMTPREGEVIALIGQGLPNKEIAGRLNIAVRTVKSHVRNIMEKLTLHSRREIATYARRDQTP